MGGLAGRLRINLWSSQGSKLMDRIQGLDLLNKGYIHLVRYLTIVINN